MKEQQNILKEDCPRFELNNAQMVDNAGLMSDPYNGPGVLSQIKFPDLYTEFSSKIFWGKQDSIQIILIQKSIQAII